MAWRVVWPGSARWFRWAVGGVKPKMNRAVSRPVAKPATTPVAKPVISDTVNTKPIQVRKPGRRF